MAGTPPTLVSSAADTSKLVPIRLSIVIVRPVSSSPRACSTAARPLTPVPVGERSTSPSAKTQTLRLCTSPPRGCQKIVP